MYSKKKNLESEPKIKTEILALQHWPIQPHFRTIVNWSCSPMNTVGAKFFPAVIGQIVEEYPMTYMYFNLGIVVGRCSSIPYFWNEFYLQERKNST